MEFTQEQKQQLMNAVEDPKTEFVFLPSAELKKRIASGTDPMLTKLSSKLVVTMLELPSDQGIRLDKKLILKYINGSIDEKHSYVFSLGEIRVIDSTFLIQTDDK